MSSRETTHRRFFTTSEIARYCEVSNDGVLKWIKAGKLRAFATPGGHYRVSNEDFRAFLKRYEFPIFDELEDETTRLLIVDDDASIRELIQRRVRAVEPHWILDEAADGYEAGLLIGSQRPHLIIVDLMMPNVDGIALCRSIRSHAQGASIGIVTISGAHDATLERRARRAGADAHLSKPIDFPQLLDTLSRLRHGRTIPTDPTSARVSGSPRLRGNSREV